MDHNQIHLFYSLKGYYLSQGANEDDMQDAIMNIIKVNPDFTGRTERSVMNYFITSVFNHRYTRKYRTNSKIQIVHQSDYDMYDHSIDIMDKSVVQSYLADSLNENYREEIDHKFITIYHRVTDLERELIIDRFFNNMTYREISETKNVNLNTIKVRFNSIKNKFIKWQTKTTNVRT
tara:strand:+ start:1808 stop:2338 length:531 start_codon:yes stop_codon:yes gene_type:complete